MIFQLFIYSMIVASISYTITEAGIFDWLRAWAKGKHHKLGELFSCGYCMSHWVSFFVVIIYQPRLFYSWLTIIDYFFTAIFIVWLSTVQWRLMILSGKIIKLLEEIFKSYYFKRQNIQPIKSKAA